VGRALAAFAPATAEESVGRLLVGRLRKRPVSFATGARSVSNCLARGIFEALRRVLPFVADILVSLREEGGGGKIRAFFTALANLRSQPKADPRCRFFRARPFNAQIDQVLAFAPQEMTSQVDRRRMSEFRFRGNGAATLVFTKFARGGEPTTLFAFLDGP